MRTEVAAWVNEMLPSVDVDSLSAEETANLEANYDGRQAKAVKAVKGGSPFEKRKNEQARRKAIEAIADRYMELRPDDAEEIEKMYNHAIESEMSAQDFRTEMAEAALPQSYAPMRRSSQMVAGNELGKVLEAAVCRAGRLPDIEKMYEPKVLEMADKHYKNIGLKQLLFIGAEQNGYRGSLHGDVTRDVLMAAFAANGYGPRNRMIQADGFSTISIPDVVSNVANKYIFDGWNAVDMTPMRVASIRSMKDFKASTTVSLTGDLQYEKLGAQGQIKHGTLGDQTYTQQVNTYARMLQISRQDIINDDLGALTAVPRRLGRGAALALNDVFWTLFLNNSSFFTSGRNNVNTAVADMTVGGLAATETIFMNQTDPDGKPLAVQPAILLVPTALKAAAFTLMNSERLITGATSVTQGDANIWRGRFRVESSPYMSNSSYTGYSAQAWYMLADPGTLPVVEIGALGGRVEPTVETSQADFDELGIQMRGYSDIGVNFFEYRGGVAADGGSS